MCGSQTVSVPANANKTGDGRRQTEDKNKSARDATLNKWLLRQVNTLSCLLPQREGAEGELAGETRVHVVFGVGGGNGRKACLDDL